MLGPIGGKRERESESAGVFSCKVINPIKLGSHLYNFIYLNDLPIRPYFQIVTVGTGALCEFGDSGAQFSPHYQVHEKLV